MTKIKICGVTTVEDAQLCVDAGADFLGFVLSDSPRRVSYGRLHNLATAVGARCRQVGVFATEADLLDFSQNCDVELDHYQIYFDPSQATIRQPRLGIIRAYWMRADAPIDLTPLTMPALLDFKHGSIEQMQSQLAAHREVVGNTVMLAGRLTPGTVGGVIRALRPWGVDAARGTESAPGKKDPGLVMRFVEAVKDAG